MGGTEDQIAGEAKKTEGLQGDAEKKMEGEAQSAEGEAKKTGDDALKNVEEKFPGR